MAVVRKRFALSNPTPGAQTIFYTVPTGKVAILRNLVLSTDSTQTNVVQGLIINGAGFVWDTYVADSYTPNIYQLSTYMTAGETLAAASSVALGYTQVDLVECDPADVPTMFRLTALSIGTTQNYSPPAGKKWRLRELVISPHSVTTDINIFISGIGYIYRGKIQGYKPVVEQVDLTVHPGENLGVHAGANPIHAWFSGVEEDA